MSARSSTNDTGKRGPAGMTDTMTADAANALEYLRAATAEVVKEQVAYAEIPVLSYRADERARRIIREWKAQGLSPRRDKIGNVIAELKGSSPKTRPTLIVSAHLDSVFHGLTGIKVRRKGGVLYAPGICDDASGVANMALLVRAMKRFGVRPKGTIVFVASVGEESGHEAWGMEHFWKEARYRNPWFLGIDGAIPGRVVTRALSTWSPKIAVRAAGGHSYVCFGRPNPVHMLSRIVVKLTRMKANRAKDSSYNANMVEGGTAPNVIPQVASVTINIRSSDKREFERMKANLLRFIEEARREELKWATATKWLDVEISANGRPGGRVRETHPLPAAAAKALRAEGVRPEFSASSTDANMPLSMGIPAIVICAGGRAENMHSLNEWHDMKGRTKELAALARIVFGISC